MKKEYYCNVLIVGCGAAGLACAYNLSRLGVKDVTVACESRNYGTSRNTGSDKQTYYKLSLSGSENDSVYKMANELFSHGGINGDNALCEAASSAECFFRLTELGVPFVKNEYGEYAGYKTDFDSCKRGTSAGPLTSKYMTESLERAVEKTDTEFISGLFPVKIIKSGNTARGCVFADGHGFTTVFANYVVFATGGEAAMFGSSVFPKSQFGAMGVLIDSGCELSNFNYWQYGLASVDFRWNVSGSYQQVIPRYVSVDKNGREHEFLRDSLSDCEIFEYTFLKGYEWPFDSERINASSKIDLLVKEQTDKGFDVYIDYTKNPQNFSFDILPEKARQYLENSSAMQPTPVQRLLSMNVRAYKNYLAHGIDLKNDYLRIALCSQHQNGGASVDADYETSVGNLFAIGEAAGVFGAYRPGGSALNSTQVSALRCAEKIAKMPQTAPPEKTGYSLPQTTFDDDGMVLKWQKITDRICLNIRDVTEIKKYVPGLISDLASCRYYKSREVLTATLAFYKSCIFAGENIGSYGCSVYTENGAITEKSSNKNKIVVFDGECSLREVRPIPKSEQWFEKVYNKRSENI